MRILVATRSQHKLQEIRQLLAEDGVQLLDLDEAGIPSSPEEDGIEAFDTFEANALAKARYFAQRSGLPTLADDSGLCVDALDGGPGVWSKRFSGRSDLNGSELDESNNDTLLERLDGVPEDRRGAHYTCVMALVLPDGREIVRRGTVDGIILEERRGTGGFGYDPLFFVPEIGCAFGETTKETKNRLSHRAEAIRAIAPQISEIASS